MKTFINKSWQFTSTFDKQLLASKKTDIKIKLQTVDLPHSVVQTPYNYFDAKIYQTVSGYRKTFKTAAAWKNRRVFITFEGAAHEATVYLNGQLLGTHSTGYTAFTYEMTKFLAPQGSENVLVVKLDSNETIDVPPFGFVIDYMTYGGIYREVFIEDKPQIFIDDIYVTTKENSCDVKFALSEQVSEGTQFNVTVAPWSKTKGKPITVSVAANRSTSNLHAEITVPDVKMWTPETPDLYTATVELVSKNKGESDSKSERFGFRDIVMNAEGLFLNGKKYKLRGLDRHQSYAYQGYAMPESLQRFDAKVLKEELGLNAVRTSHYPQSHHFIDACDELGLLVFTEIPGWQHIGSSAKWRKQAIQNVNEMVLQYRNHPSIFLWGVRINESPDDDELYSVTNSVARELDPSRPTGGVRCFKKSNLLEDVYTYNEFVHRGDNEGCEPKSKVTSNMKKAYLISEYNGHMYPTKMFDDEIHRTNHALRHAKVINDVAGHSDIAGSFGWCAFDYNTHEDFGSGDGICYHGVMDMFRNPKMAALVYKSQAEDEVVLDVSSSMDVGEHPACTRGKNWIFTNADSIKMYFNDIFITEYFPSNSPYKNLKHPPILIDDYVGERFVKEEKMSQKSSEQAKAVINFNAIYGQIKMPFSILLKCAALILKGFNYAKLRKLYDNYVGNWGGAASVYKFEAIKDGKVVKTILKGPIKNIQIKADISNKELSVENGWDASSVRLSVKDQYGNTVPYYMESVRFSVSGPIELIGPETSCFRGGYAGTYVRTTGKTGKAQLKVESADLSCNINFSVL